MSLNHYMPKNRATAAFTIKRKDRANIENETPYNFNCIRVLNAINLQQNLILFLDENWGQLNFAERCGIEREINFWDALIKYKALTAKVPVGPVFYNMYICRADVPFALNTYYDNHRRKQL